MVQMPYEKYYTRQLRNGFLVVSNLIQIILAATFSYQLYKRYTATAAYVRRTCARDPTHSRACRQPARVGS
jgi:hypothetical protein